MPETEPETLYAKQWEELFEDDEERRELEQWAQSWVDNTQLGPVDLSAATTAGASGAMRAYSLAERLSFGLLPGQADDINRAAQALDAAREQRLADTIPAGAGLTLARGVGSAASSAVANAPLGALGVAGMIVGGAGMAGNEAYTEGIDAGLGEGKAALYALTSAANEGIITGLATRIGLGGLERGVSQQASKYVASKYGAAGVEALRQMAAEGGEEALIATTQAVNKRLSGVDPNALDPSQLASEVGDAFMAAVITAGYGEAVRARVGKNVESTAESVEQDTRQAAKALPFPIAPDAVAADTEQTAAEPTASETPTAEATQPLAPAQIVDRRTGRGRPRTAQERIDATGPQAPEGMAFAAYQDELDAAAGVFSGLPELAGSTIERHDNSLRIKFGDTGRSAEAIIGTPKELAEAMAKAADGGWSSLRASGAAGTMTEAQFKKLSTRRKVEMLEPLVQGSIGFSVEGQAVPLGTDSLLYLRTGTVTENTAAHELAHRAFVLQATDSELASLRDYMREIGLAGQYGDTIRTDANFQEDVVQRLYLPYVRGELQSPNTPQETRVSRILARIRRFFERLGVVSERAPVAPSQAQQAATQVLDAARSGELQRRADPAFRMPEGREEILNARLQRVQDEGAAEARREKKLRGARTGLTEAENRELRAETAAERAARQALKEEAAGDRLPVEEATRDQIAQTRAERAARQALAEEAAGDRLPIEEAAREQATQTRAERAARQAEREARLRGEEAAAAERQPRREAVRETALQRQEMAEDRRMRQEESRTERELTAARREEAQTRNLRLSAEEAARLRDLQQELNSAEAMLDEARQLGIEDDIANAVDEIRTEIRSLRREKARERAEGRARRTENRATAAEGRPGPLAATQQPAPAPEVRELLGRRPSAREADTGRDARLRNVGQFMLNRLGWRKTLDAVRTQAEQRGGDYSKVSDNLLAGLTAARGYLMQKTAEAVRRGTAQTYQRALAEAVDMYSLARGGTGASLRDALIANEDLGPLERANAIYDEVTRLKRRDQQAVDRLRRQGEHDKADEMAADIAARQWERYTERLAELGLSESDLMRMDLAATEAEAMKNLAMNAQLTKADVAGILMKLGIRASIYSPYSAARIAFISLPIAVTDNLAQLGRGTIGSIGRAAPALSLGMVPSLNLGPTLSDYALSTAVGLSRMRAAPQAILETLASGHCYAYSQINPRDLRDALDPEHQTIDVDILTAGGGARARLLRKVIGVLDSSSRMLGAADQALRLYTGGAHMTLGAIAHLQETRPDLKPGTPGYDSELARLMDPATTSAEVRENANANMLDATAARPFEGLFSRNQLDPIAWASEINKFIDRTTANAPQAVQAIWKNLFVVYKVAIRGGEQTGRMMPITSGIILIRDFFRAQHPDARLVHKQRMWTQVFRTGLAHALPLLLGNLLDDDSAEELAKGNVAGVNARYFPLIGPLLEANGRFMQAEWDSVESYYDTTAEISQVMVMDMVPGRRLFAEGLSKRSSLVDAAILNSPAWRVMEATKAGVGLSDAEGEERFYAFVNGFAPIRDMLMLFDEGMVDYRNDRTRVDFAEPGFTSALGLREEQ